jgi:galactokinase
MKRALKDPAIWEVLYGDDPVFLESQINRFHELIDLFADRIGRRTIRFFSTPGRTELGGNHTDHNHGNVLAASIDLDSIAVAAPNENGLITLYSLGYDTPFSVSLEHLDPVESERGTTTALLRGVACYLQKKGHSVGGVDVCMSSQVPVGSGLSSSASVEILFATIFNALYNNGRIPPLELAKAGQFAENEYFGKPSGLMDQIACAVGGIVAIDFETPEAPGIETIDYEFQSSGYRMVVVDTGGHHTHLTDQYAAIHSEMKQVARYFGQDVVRGLEQEDLLREISDLRKTVGDRAVLRALHFIQDNHRVEHQVDALRSGQIDRFLKLVQQSGESSFRWLQNIYDPAQPEEQGVSLALALSESILETEPKGACRVHGGGFAGTILAFVPVDRMDAYTQLMTSVFGPQAVRVLNLRSVGTLHITPGR